jgi:hypothetical protein
MRTKFVINSYEGGLPYLVNLVDAVGIGAPGALIGHRGAAVVVEG